MNPLGFVAPVSVIMEEISSSNLPYKLSVEASNQVDDREGKEIYYIQKPMNDGLQ